MRFSLTAPLALATALAVGGAPAWADASTDMSAISMLPVASVVVGASVLSDAAQASQAAVAIAGTFVVRGVEASGRGTLIALEQVSDGAHASVEIAGRSSAVVGASVTTTTLASGMVLSAAGQVIAFVPNKVGRALLYNELVVR